MARSVETVAQILENPANEVLPFTSLLSDVFTSGMLGLNRELSDQNVCGKRMPDWLRSKYCSLPHANRAVKSRKS